ncbi:globin-coupled sensor protein [Tepidiforma flava]|uniref:Globin-coupled sensor protein n=1 Tax=Tepidiforma flava TaxID=3004094 RepID=A0ABY7MAJ7_9CHLR|nr:globin-coupled sensor protein [Tepidiforma flava]WBL36588.1 globin-coupled sensor protein [Tepidiforma flava]
MSDRLTQRLHIDRADQALRLRWIGITDREAAAIRRAADLIRPHAQDVVRRFYDHSSAFPEWQRKVREAGSDRSRLEAAQLDYLLRLLDARFDEDYFEHRLRVGAAHARLQIEPRWNVGNYGLYGDLLFPLLAAKLKGRELAETIAALVKAFVLDASLAVETFISEGVLEKLVDIHDTLGQPLQNLGSNIAQVDQATREIASAVSDVARGAASQTATMSALNSEIDALGRASGDVARAAAEQSSALDDAVRATDAVRAALERARDAAAAARERGDASLAEAREGTAAVQQTIEAMGAIRDTVRQTAGEIEDLGRQGSQIGAIVQVIDDIAAQTNLLALNAAIEAARAGEQGRGFAVVAENVRSLAERTAVATKEIAALIAGVQGGTQRAVRAMEASIANVEEGAARAERAGAALGRIVQGASAVRDEIERISEAAASVDQSVGTLVGVLERVAGLARESAARAAEMTAAADRVRNAVTDASATAEQSAAASQQVSASVEEIAAQVSEIARETQSLAGTTAELAAFIARFGALAHNSRGETFAFRQAAAAA